MPSLCAALTCKLFTTPDHNQQKHRAYDNKRALQGWVDRREGWNGKDRQCEGILTAKEKENVVRMVSIEECSAVKTYRTKTI